MKTEVIELSSDDEFDYESGGDEGGDAMSLDGETRCHITISDSDELQHLQQDDEDDDDEVEVVEDGGVPPTPPEPAPPKMSSRQRFKADCETLIKRHAQPQPADLVSSTPLACYTSASAHVRVLWLTLVRMGRGGARGRRERQVPPREASTSAPSHPRARLS